MLWSVDGHPAPPEEHVRSFVDGFGRLISPHLLPLFLDPSFPPPLPLPSSSVAAGKNVVRPRIDAPPQQKTNTPPPPPPFTNIYVFMTNQPTAEAVVAAVVDTGRYLVSEKEEDSSTSSSRDLLVVDSHSSAAVEKEPSPGLPLTTTMTTGHTRPNIKPLCRLTLSCQPTNVVHPRSTTPTKLNPRFVCAVGEKRLAAGAPVNIP